MRYIKLIKKFKESLSFIKDKVISNFWGYIAGGIVSLAVIIVTAQFRIVYNFIISLRNISTETAIEKVNYILGEPHAVYPFINPADGLQYIAFTIDLDNIKQEWFLNGKENFKPISQYAEAQDDIEAHEESCCLGFIAESNTALNPYGIILNTHCWSNNALIDDELLKAIDIGNDDYKKIQSCHVDHGRHGDMGVCYLLDTKDREIYSIHISGFEDEPVRIIYSESVVKNQQIKKYLDSMVSKFKIDEYTEKNIYAWKSANYNLQQNKLKPIPCDKPTISEDESIIVRNKRYRWIAFYEKIYSVMKIICGFHLVLMYIIQIIIFI
jgi:hypothetical protein